MRPSPLALAVLGLVAALPRAATAGLPPLIPRDVLFGNPERAHARVSPDGQRLAWLAPDKKNVLQVWVKTLGKDDDKVVTADPKRGIREFRWAENDRTLLYLQDQDGDENYHVYGVDLASGSVRDYTAFQGVRADIVAADPTLPNQVLVSLNARDRTAFDVYRLDLDTGALVLDTQNPGDVLGWVTDAQMRVRGAQASTPEGGTELRVRDAADAPWRSWMKAGPDDDLQFLGITADGKAAILQTSIGSDTGRVVERDIATGRERLLASSPKVDPEQVLVNPTKHVVEAVSFAPGRETWTAVDPSVKADLDGLAAVADGTLWFANRDRADAEWVVAITADSGPQRYYLWDRKARKATLLFSRQPKLEGLQLAPMKPVVIKSRDGLDLNGYLSLPVGVPAKGLPLVLLVHGGPWARDTWGFNSTVQWLANRGYAVLQVNFRSSTGYGKAFLNAGNKQWGLRMHDDLLDAVQWAVKEGIADPKRVAIFGGSYGGYAALAGVTITPDAFACAVDEVGPSNLKTLLASIPPYWKAIRSMFDVRMGNVDDPKDAELIRNASPLFKADRIRKPLLIGQGANDPRVNKAESEQIVSAIEKNGGKVTYVLYPDEGHGFARPENNTDFNARAEAFLASCLGGRAEPLEGERYPGSTAVVKVVGR